MYSRHVCTCILYMYVLCFLSLLVVKLSVRFSFMADRDRDVCLSLIHMSQQYKCFFMVMLSRTRLFMTSCGSYISCLRELGHWLWQLHTMSAWIWSKKLYATWFQHTSIIVLYIHCTRRIDQFLVMVADHLWLQPWHAMPCRNFVKWGNFAKVLIYVAQNIKKKTFLSGATVCSIRRKCLFLVVASGIDRQERNPAVLFWTGQSCSLTELCVCFLLQSKHSSTRIHCICLCRWYFAMEEFKS